MLHDILLPFLGGALIAIYVGMASPSKTVAGTILKGLTLYGGIVALIFALR